MNRILVQGCKAGLVAGLIWGLLVLFFVSPLIVEAEKYENLSTESSVQANSGESHTHFNSHSHSHSHSHKHSHSVETENEENGWSRSILTLLGTSLLGIAFGILLSFGVSWGAYRGLLSFDSPLPIYIGSFVGLIGFAIFQGIPSLGLPPPLPGVIGAEQTYSARQDWWMLSVFCSTIACFALFSSLKRATLQRGILLSSGLLVLAFPFWVGAPHEGESNAPEALRMHFLEASLLTNATYWVILGTILFYLLNRKSFREGLINR